MRQPLRIGLVALALAGGSCGGATQDVEPPPGQTHETASDTTPEGEGTSSAQGSVSCGGQTCGTREYCLIECTCCGTRIPDPSEASASYTCLPIPEGCDPAAMCGCEGMHHGLCSSDRRTVETPCA